MKTQSRTGKIARLPLAVREELNRRLSDGESGPKILPWLNSLPEVKAVMEEDFEGLLINDKNLSDWRLGGFQDWLKRRRHVDSVREMAQWSVKLAKAGGGGLADGASAILSGKILEVLEQLEGLVESTNGQRTTDEGPSAVSSQLSVAGIAEAIEGLTLSVMRLRKGDQNAEQLKLMRERLGQGAESLRIERERLELTLRQYEEKVAAQKTVIQNELKTARSGGLTPETLQRIEEAVQIL